MSNFVLKPLERKDIIKALKRKTGITMFPIQSGNNSCPDTKKEFINFIMTNHSHSGNKLVVIKSDYITNSDIGRFVVVIDRR